MSKNITITMSVSKVNELSVNMAEGATVQAITAYVPSDILVNVPQFNAPLNTVIHRSEITRKEVLITVPSDWFFAHATPLLKRPNRAVAYLTRTQTVYSYTYQYFDVNAGALKEGTKVLNKRIVDTPKALKALSTAVEITVKVTEIKELTQLYGMDYQTLLDYYLDKGGVINE